MICYMHEGNPYGTLKVGNKVILATNLAAMIGATLADVEGWLNELESSGVFDRDEQGAIYSRRMIRDEIIRNARAAGGKLGGNPSLTKRKVNLEDNLKVEKEVKQKPTPSSSSSTSSSSSIRVLSKDNTNDAEMIYSAYPKKVGKQEAMKAISKSLKHIPACELLPIVQQYAKAREGADQQYTPNPATWFNQGRWMDDPETWKQKQQQTGTFGVKKHAGDNDNLDDEPDIMSVLIR